MRPGDARAAALRLADLAVAGDEAGWHEGAAELKALDGPSWLLLDQAARAFRHPGGRPVDGARGWLSPSVDDASGFVAAVTSFHADGRFRERATRVLASVDTPLATRTLAVRLLDHVPQVRHEALAATLHRLDLVTVDLVLEVLLAGRDRLHASSASALVQEHLFARSGEVLALRHLMASDRRLVRRWAFDVARERGVLEDADLVVAAQYDEDQWVQAMCSRWLMQSDPASLILLLGARPVEARLAAVTRVSDAALDDETLAQLLLDRAPRVREQARWRARRRGFDVLAVCRRALAITEPARVRAAALDGLGSLGDETDLPAVLAGLHDPSARVRVAALGAVASLAATPDAVGVTLPLLDDHSGRVSSAAARRLARQHVTPAEVADFWRATRPTTRRAAWRVSRESGSWDRVEADLRAASDEDPDLAGLGEAGLRSWLHISAATTWESLSDEQRERIATHLVATQLDEEARRLVAFHAGIRPSSQPVSSPGCAVVREDELTKRRWWRSHDPRRPS